MRQVLQGNLGAYVDLVKRYTAQIAALCRAHVPRADVVEDLVQETFLRGLDRLATLRESGRFGFWLYAIARNLCRDWRSDPEHEHVSLDDVATGSAVTSGEGDRADRTADVRSCIRRLPVELREVVGIYYAGGRARARKMLRACLEGENRAERAPPGST
ncbi:MAG: sigma-70 family RNA polymerase sigma factor [Gemmataceae bacterium]